MQLLETAINSAPAPEECARELLEVIPQVMRLIRAELRRHRQVELSVAQFRALAFLRRQAGASLSELAEHIGLSLPSMSKLVDGLVARDLVARRDDPADRRRVALCLTPAGDAAVKAAFEATQADLAQRLTQLGPEQRSIVISGMAALRAISSTE